MKKLIIAEKLSVAQSIANAIRVDKDPKDGYIKGNDKYIITWCSGHMLAIKDAALIDPKYKTWTLEQLPIIPEKWSYTALESNRRQLEKIFKLIDRDDVSSLVCATDAGREGELIFRLVYVASGTKKPFERLWISTMEEDSIRKGLDNLHPSSEYDNLYYSALARSRADWLVGINSTRFYTVGFSSLGTTLRVGRVQTPTLAMIVERDRQIAEFKVTKQWAVVKDFGDWKLETEKFPSEDAAIKCKTDTEGKKTTITFVKHTKKKVGPPLLHSLTTLQQEANRRFGMSASETLDAAQSLYEKKLLSYPRTDSNYLTSDMGGTFGNIVRRLAASYDKNLVVGNIERLLCDDKVTDHYALILTDYYIRNSRNVTLAENEKRVVRLVAARMIESVSPWYLYEEIKVQGVTDHYEFSGTGRTDVQLGWKKVGKDLLKIEDRRVSIFPADIIEGNTYTASSTEIANRDTRPPAPYTEAALLDAMEKAGAEDMPEDVERKGIGTSATRAVIIEGLLSSGYIVRKKATSVTYLAPTELGKNLISIVDEGLKSVKTTSDWECRLKDIEHGKDTLSSFCTDIAESIRKLISDNADKVSEQKPTNVVLGRCPRCGSPVVDKGQLAKCTNENCGKALFKKNKFISGPPLSNGDIKKLLEGEEIQVKVHSSKKNKDYQAFVSLDSEKSADGPYMGLKTRFPERAGKPTGKKPYRKKQEAAT